MEARPFGAGGPLVPVVGQGSWQMENDDRAGCVAALRRGLDLGMTHVDTAELYGSGVAETIVAEAIAGRRDEVFLVSKVLPQNASRAGTVRACEQSLRRLGTDRLDVYLLHWRGAHPLAETFAAFEELQTAGKIRAWGVSNFDVDDLDEARALLGPGQTIACNQVLYHLEERGIERRVLRACKRHGIALVAYSPFGSGQFPSAGSTGGRLLADVAKKHGASPRQVALRFLARDPAVFVIPKAASVAHAEDNAAAGALRLDEDDVARLDAAFPLGRDRGLPML